MTQEEAARLSKELHSAKEERKRERSSDADVRQVQLFRFGLLPIILKIRPAFPCIHTCSVKSSGKANLFTSTMRVDCGLHFTPSFLSGSECKGREADQAAGGCTDTEPDGLLHRRRRGQYAKGGGHPTGGTVSPGPWARHDTRGSECLGAVGGSIKFDALFPCRIRLHLPAEFLACAA